MPPAVSKSLSAAEKTRLIKAEAARLGFDLSGVTNPAPPPHLSVYQNWLAAGRHGEMGYLATERAVQRRSNPQAILPECRSILVLGARYNPPHLHLDRAPDQASRGRMAAYAWGNDYHDVLEARLKTLAAFCETLAEEPFTCRWYTDTGPLLERELAQRAGLGWIGKNTCLINPRAGSYFLLSELLLSLELVPDQAITTDHCGTCQRCIEACPTACILPDRTLDARRCISYQTIEQKGPVPADLRPLLGDWVFGCDICQEVCPWNVRFAEPSADPAFQSTPGLVPVDLVDTLGLSAEEFNRRYRKSAVRRTKRRGLLRNTALVLGNAASRSVHGTGQQDREALAEALKDAEALVRGHAAWALGQVGGDDAFRVLKTALKVEEEEWVRAEIEGALARYQYD